MNFATQTSFQKKFETCLRDGHSGLTGALCFTLEQTNRIYDQLGTAATLPQYLQPLKAVGVDICDSFITDGHSEYFGKEGHKVVSSSAHEKLKIAEASNRQEFINHLNLHSQRKTSHLEMSRGLADSGIEKWTF